MRVAILDLQRHSYDRLDLRRRAMGGTEASAVRVAEGLAAAGLEVVFGQGGRTTRSHQGGVHYRPVQDVLSFAPSHVLVLRDSARLPAVRRRFPGAALILWSHDLFPEQQQAFDALVASPIEQAVAQVVCVSAFHLQTFRRMLRCRRTGITSSFIHNPIDEHLRPDGSPVDAEKLIYIASPHKGLAYTVEVFLRLQATPGLERISLTVANPGYLDTPPLPPNVRALGPLSHQRVLEEVRSALCVLHLNWEHPETFGLAHAESEAVGTPVITSKLGANSEVLASSLLIDPDEVFRVGTELHRWRRGSRPAPRPRAHFRRSFIVSEWWKLLHSVR